MKSKKNLIELMNQFKSEIENGKCNVNSYQDVTRWLELFIEESPDEILLGSIINQIGLTNPHIEDWRKLKFTQLELMSAEQKMIFHRFHRTCITKMILDGIRNILFYKTSTPEMLSKMEIFDLFEMTFHPNFPYLNTDEIVTEFYEFIQDGYQNEKIVFNKIYATLSVNNVAA